MVGLQNLRHDVCFSMNTFRFLITITKKVSNPLKIALEPTRTMTSAARKKLDGKVAVVTASTDGIGLAIAKSLAENGAKVVISSRRQNNVNEAVKKLHSEGLTDVTGVVCHVANGEQRTKLFNTAVEKYGGIDILVSNAAANPAVGPVLECDEEVWDKIFNINLKCSYLLAKEVIPHLRKRGGGSIVFVSSIAGFQPFRLLGAYSVSKTALLGLTKTAAQDLAPENIRVNCLAPGIIETKFSGLLVDDPATKETALMQIPMNRFGKPEEMGGIVAFLCSDDASYITGENIIASGGMPSRL